MRYSIQNDVTMKVLKRLPEKYHNNFIQVVKEDGLIDDCKYMVYFTENINFAGYDSVPCKTITEAIYFIKNATERSY